ncbi:hypothetical protein MANES_01G004532v8 [Manihot esculenta]|uniref:Uncharacterized protein n=1 Tax=Manihot esculenta TaxID=3983 RepID=A0ACB7I9J0_MANES|nr:hypothetical protein MANES_01G004532v8 [Manihot esculenta]
MTLLFVSKYVYVHGFCILHHPSVLFMGIKEKSSTWSMAVQLVDFLFFFEIPLGIENSKLFWCVFFWRKCKWHSC